MPSTTIPIVISAATDAAFRQFCSTIHDAFLSHGLVDASSSFSTLNFATDTRSTSQRVRIYRFNDSFQPTHPIFIRLEVQNPSVITTVSYSIAVSDSTGSDGNLNGNVFGAYNLYYRNTAINSSSSLSVHGSGSRFIFANLLTTTSPAPNVFAIERLTDTTGSYTNRGFVFITFSDIPVNSNNRQRSTNVLLYGSGSTADLNWRVALRNVASSTLNGTQSVSPVYAFAGEILPPPTCLMVVHTSEAPEVGTTAPVPVYGSEVQYLALPRTIGPHTSGSNHITPSNWCTLMRFD
jgi:hypothetical protein